MTGSHGIAARPRVFAVALAALAVCGAPGARADLAGNATVFQRHVETHPSQGEVRVVEGARATLITTAAGAFASVTTRELVPGHAYTLWWVVINVPAACQTSPCAPADVLQRTARTRADVGYADGLIADAEGSARFASHLPVGRLRHAWFGTGFDNPQGAEIHLVINDHGPLVPELARPMLGSYRGGCKDESLPAAFPATAKADGTPGPNTCRLVQDVIFTRAAADAARAE